MTTEAAWRKTFSPLGRAAMATARVSARAAAAAAAACMPAALDRYIARIILVPVLAIVAALGLLMLLERALVLLSEMTALGMSPRYFPSLMLRLVPYYLMQAVPAAFVVSLILSIGRMSADHEWDVMAAAGVPPWRMAVPMTVIGLLLAVLTLAVSGWLEPVGRYGYRSMHAYAVSESRLRTLQSKVIYAPSGDAMLTVDAIEDGRLRGLFLWLDKEQGREMIATAPTGRVGMRDSPSALDFAMTDGLMLTDDNREARFTTLSGSHLLAAAATARARGRDARELTLSELIAQDPSSLVGKARTQRVGEIYGRIARSFSIVVLPWIVLPLLLAGSGRQRRNWPAVGLIIALVVIFYHGVNFGRNLVGNGSLGIWRASLLTVALPLLAAFIAWHGGKHGRNLPLPRWFAGRRRPHRAKRRLESHPPVFRKGLSVYLAKRLFAMTATVLTSLVLLLQLVDLFERGETLVRSGAGLEGFAYYAWCRLPETMLQAMPIAMLGGALLVWVRMQVTGELVAIQAAGISIFGIVRRALTVPILAGLAMIAISELWSPVSQMAFSQWWEKLEPADSEVSPDKPRWFRMGDEIVRAAMADPAGEALSALHIYRRDRAGRLAERIDAARAVWTGAEWRLREAVDWRISAAGVDTRPYTDFPWKTALRPPQVRQFFAAPVPLSGRNAWAAQNDEVPVDRAGALYRTRILMTFTIAAAPLVMLLLTVALIVASARETQLAWGLFQCLAGGLAFLVINGYCEVMGLAGDLPPWLAVGAAPLVFGGLGVERMLRADGAR